MFSVVLCHRIIWCTLPFIILEFTTVAWRISLWYLCAPQKFAKVVWVFCPSFPPNFQYLRQISVFECPYSCLTFDDFFNKVNFYRFFLQILLNKNFFLNCLGASWLRFFVSNVGRIFLLPSHGVSVTSWWYINFSCKCWWFCVFVTVIITFLFLLPDDVWNSFCNLFIFYILLVRYFLRCFVLFGRFNLSFTLLPLFLPTVLVWGSLRIEFLLYFPHL